MHLLAYYYKWGENEVLNCKKTRRLKWCEKIAEQIKAENNAYSDEELPEVKSNKTYTEGY